MIVAILGLFSDSASRPLRMSFWQRKQVYGKWSCFYTRTFKKM